MLAVALLYLGHAPGLTIDIHGAIFILAVGVLACTAVAFWAPNDPPNRLRSRSARRPASEFLVRRARWGSVIATRAGRQVPVRLACLLVLLGVAAALVAYLAAYIPVQIPVLPRSQSARYWPAAAGAAAFVIAFDIALVALSVRVSRRASDERGRRSILPPGLQFQRVSTAAVGASAAVSAVLLIATATAGAPLWFAALAALLPWLPAFAFETVWKYKHYGLYALFLVVTVLQVGHVGEHAAQVTQLLATHGDLSRSHGVFGQLDFETVHFFWDSAIWLSTALVAYRFSRNGWLWVSFVVASMHEIEHIYLYWLFIVHADFYMQGGLAGIMGRGGVIGSPLYRPYLHFIYNLLVVVPMLLALGYQTKVVVQKSRASTAGGVPLGDELGLVAAAEATAGYRTT